MLPRWMKWLFVGFLAYLIFTGSRLSHAPQPTQPQASAPAITPQEYPVLAKTLDLDRWRRGINPDAVAQDHCGFDTLPRSGLLGLKISDDTPGSGDGAACGDTLSLRLIVWGSNGTPAYTDTVVLTLGVGEIAYGIDAGLVGIRPHGTRTLVLSPAALRRGRPEKTMSSLSAVLTPNKLAVVTVERLK